MRLLFFLILGFISCFSNVFGGVDDPLWHQVEKARKYVKGFIKGIQTIEGTSYRKLFLEIDGKEEIYVFDSFYPASYQGLLYKLQIKYPDDHSIESLIDHVEQQNTQRQNSYQHAMFRKIEPKNHHYKTMLIDQEAKQYCNTDAYADLLYYMHSIDPSALSKIKNPYVLISFNIASPSDFSAIKDVSDAQVKNYHFVILHDVEKIAPLHLFSDSPYAAVLQITAWKRYTQGKKMSHHLVNEEVFKELQSSAKVVSFYNEAYIIKMDEDIATKGDHQQNVIITLQEEMKELFTVQTSDKNFIQFARFAMQANIPVVVTSHHIGSKKKTALNMKLSSLGLSWNARYGLSSDSFIYPPKSSQNFRFIYDFFSNPLFHNTIVSKKHEKTFYNEKFFEAVEKSSKKQCKNKYYTIINSQAFQLPLSKPILDTWNEIKLYIFGVSLERWLKQKVHYFSCYDLYKNISELELYLITALHAKNIYIKKNMIDKMIYHIQQNKMLVGESERGKKDESSRVMRGKKSSDDIVSYLMSIFKT